ncbi:MAG: putative secreted protein [Bacteroidetes bacterium]|jgi:hypothetical protein|nr:putative secreted protein [Bacteroidota bacterium]
MKKIGYIISIGVLFSTIMTSCHTNDKKLETNALTFDSLKLTKVYYLDNDSTKPSCHLSIAFIYPAKGLAEKDLKILCSNFISTMFDQAYADSLPNIAAKCYANDYVSLYKEDAKSFYNDDTDDSEDNQKDYYSYFETLINRIIFNKYNLLSFQVEQKNYKGGANSFTSFRNYVINLKTGEFLTEESIYNAGYEKMIHTLLINKLLQQNNAKNISELEELGYFGIDEIASNHNFLIDEDGITYIFNRGESSALSLNEIRIHFSFNEIESILKPNSPIQPLLKE